MEATVAERGQITLPKEARDALGLTKGMKLIVEVQEGSHHPPQGRGRCHAAIARHRQVAPGHDHRRHHA